MQLSHWDIESVEFPENFPCCPNLSFTVMPFQIMSFYCGWLITILASNQNINVRRSSIIAELKQLDMDSNAHFPGTNETGFISSLRGGGYPTVIQTTGWWLSKQETDGHNDTLLTSPTNANYFCILIILYLSSPNTNEFQFSLQI